MEQIPLRKFDGWLKQVTQDSLSALERELFEVLFPGFQGSPDAERAYEEAKKNGLLTALSPLISLLPGEARPRRFSGHDLPRGRYHVVCSDAGGNDSQTLAHELRAYRDPFAVGMVEVI
jgi:hypothetical protein